MFVVYVCSLLRRAWSTKVTFNFLKQRVSVDMRACGVIASAALLPAGAGALASAKERTLSQVRKMGKYKWVNIDHHQI